MVKQKGSIANSDLAAGLCGLFLTLSGVNGINDALYRPSNTWDWKISIGLVIFGGMIMGVAVNRISNNSGDGKQVLPNKPTRKKSKKVR